MTCATASAPPMGGLPSDDASDWRSVTKQAEAFNSQGMSYLKSGDAVQAFKTLVEAEDLLIRAVAAPCGDVAEREERQGALTRARAETASNLGICHKRMGSNLEAAQSLGRALEHYEIAGVDMRTLIAAHLNFSACLAESKLHERALKHAQAAVELGARVISSGDYVELRPGVPRSGVGPEPRPDDYAMLAVAYHKVAEASEGLKEWRAANLAYSQAYEVVRRSFGPDHRLTRAFEMSTKCPRRVVTPDVPGPRRAPKSTPRRLPDIPRTSSARPRKPLAPVTDEYRLGPENFPSWPPKRATHDEQVWYAMAQHHQAKEFALVSAALAQNRGSSRESPTWAATHAARFLMGNGG
mmetsp:Transcript_78164/g.217057  ORF Transcript_78164/g.217057 Transcript_78164/m.217057 type:complete len:354 (+) Transcript_78164:87-1148(+)